MPTQTDPTIHLGHEINQDNIQRPHLVNPVHWVLDQGATLPHLHYNARWGEGTDHRVLFLFLAHHYAVLPGAPTFGGVSMVPLGTPNTNGGLWYLADPPADGDFSFDFGSGLDYTTVLAVMLVGVREIPPHGVNQYSGTWDSTVNLGIGVGHGSRQTCVTFLSTRKDHGVISCSDQHVLRPGEGEFRVSVTQSATVFGSGTHTATYAGTVAESSAYEAYGVALFEVVAGTGTQATRIHQDYRIYAPGVDQGVIETRALRRLPAQFDKSTHLRALVGGCAAACDAAAVAASRLPHLAAISAAYESTLTLWGDRLGVPRRINGQPVPDRIYRRLVLAAFLALQSTGSYSEVRAVAQLLFPGRDLTIDEPTAEPGFRVLVDAGLTSAEIPLYREILGRAAAPGVANGIVEL